MKAFILTCVLLLPSLAHAEISSFDVVSAQLNSPNITVAIASSQSSLVAVEQRYNEQIAWWSTTLNPEYDLICARVNFIAIDAHADLNWTLFVQQMYFYPNFHEQALGSEDVYGELRKADFYIQKARTQVTLASGYLADSDQTAAQAAVVAATGFLTQALNEGLSPAKTTANNAGIVLQTAKALLDQLDIDYPSTFDEADPGNAGGPQP